MDDAYGRITARHYDAAYAQLRAPTGDERFYLELARETGGPVLELGCGTGRTLLPIAREGIACAGLDASPAMLETLRAKGVPEGLELFSGRMQDFDLGERRFALVTAPFRVFQHLQEVDEQLACLARVRRHLAPGGLFAFDVFVPRLDRIAAASTPEQEEACWPDGDDEVARLTSTERHHATQQLDVHMRYERRRDGVAVSSETVDFRMRWFFRYELEHLLHRAGFEDLTLYGGFDRRPFGADATDFLYLARVSPGGR